VTFGQAIPTTFDFTFNLELPYIAV